MPTRTPTPVGSIAKGTDGRLSLDPGDRELPESLRVPTVRNIADTSSLTRLGLGWIGAFAFSPDGRLLAVGMGTGLIRLFDSRTGEENARWPAHEGSLATLTFSPDGRLLASGAGDGSAKLWEPGTGRLLYTMDVGARTALIVAFSPDGQLLATGSSQGQVRLWDPEKGRELRTLEARMNARDGIAFSPGVRLLASGGGQGAIKLWGTEGRSCFPSRVIETQLTGSLSVRMGSCWPVPAMTR